MRIEIHDGVADGVRVLVWRDLVDFQGPLRMPRDRVQAETADLDTREANWIFMGHGRGARWGLSLQQVLIRRAEREAPYVQR